MKDIFLSVVVICALVAAGIGGTLADFSDSEEEVGDTLQAGTMDLKVNNLDDPNVLPFTLWMVPEKTYDITKTLRNVGTIDGWLYIHITNVQCVEANDKDINSDNVISVPEDNPEPENVAQDGGWVGQEQVAGIGDNCSAFGAHMEIVSIKFGLKGGTLTPVSLPGSAPRTLSDLECNQILIGQLPQCGPEYTIEFKFKFRDIDESFFGFDYFDVNDPHEIKWNWWPTNAYQGDKITFDVLYELLQTDYVPPGGG